nr:MAG TPA: hypothetical protein [Caudoviricetes sp.]DAL19854.1 MAG TPA_asm: hypothetical protein [Caudoviricetes sp.]
MDILCVRLLIQTDKLIQRQIQNLTSGSGIKKERVLYPPCIRVADVVVRDAGQVGQLLQGKAAGIFRLANFGGIII